MRIVEIMQNVTPTAPYAQRRTPAGYIEHFQVPTLDIAAQLEEGEIASLKARRVDPHKYLGYVLRSLGCNDYRGGLEMCTFFFLPAVQQRLKITTSDDAARLVLAAMHNAYVHFMQ